MKRRLVGFLIIIIMASVIVAAVISALFSINNYLTIKANDLKEYAHIINSVIVNDYDNNPRPSPDYYAQTFSADTGYRITFIDSTGNVLADSTDDHSNMKFDNHGKREEVIEALKGGFGESNRESTTFGKTYLYSAVAVDLPDGGKLVTRLAMEIDKWDIAKDQVIGSTLIASLVGIILAVIVTFLYSNRLLKPVRKMEKQLNATMARNVKAENIRREFVANVTHELKTPLTSISGFVETLQDDDHMNVATRHKFLEIISIETSRLARLIDDILVISDIENGRETGSNEDLDVKMSIGQVLDTLMPLAYEKNIAVHLNCEYEMYLEGNTDRFKQLMLNLVENAIKYSDPGGNVVVDVQKELVSANDSHNKDVITISVKDEGIGIAEEDMERLFERFYRVDKSRSKKEGGTGLGLAIVKHIASLFDAQLEVKSQPGKGSTFSVIFPVK